MRRAPAAAFATAVLALAACGGGGTVDELTVSGAWARPTPQGADTGVVYFAIASPVDDALVGVSVPGDVAGSAMVHEAVASGDGGGAHENHGGAAGGDMVGMAEAGRVDLPAGDTVALAPGGLHVMLMDLPERLVDGRRFTLTLTLERAGEIAVDVVVAENAP